MAYTSDPIVAIISRLNTQYFLPAIQREFVWRPDQIVELFDSILRGYPIGSFLFWQLAAENRDRWEVYNFITDARHGGTRNTLANTAGVTDLTMILDGQQRLTSLLIGLKGSYWFKKPYYPWDNPKAWEQQFLHLDLFDDPATTEDGSEMGVYYGFKFLPQTPEPDDEHYWFKVGRILDFQSEAALEEFIDKSLDAMPDTVTRGQTKLFERNLNRLYRAIWKDDVIAYYTEHEQDYDRVLDIFVRANEGGTKLSKSDLLLSMVTAKWGTVNAREEIFGLVERLNEDLPRKNNFDKDFIMKSCLVVCDLPVAYRVENFTNENLALIERRWEEIKNAIEAAVKLVNMFGMDRDTLPSANALIPIIYYMSQHPGMTLLGDSYEEVTNADRIRQWLSMALLNGVFSGHSDNALRDARRALQEHRDARFFPAEEINAALAKYGRAAVFDDLAASSFLDITYGRRETFLALSLLYDEHRWGTMQFHQDHIFPRSLFTPKRLEESGLSREQQERYQTLVNRIGNLQLLRAQENLEKLNRPFDEWLATQHPDARRRHLIPDDPSLYTFDQFERFVEAREQLIRERLRSLFSPTAEDEMRKMA